jgi:3-hydroxyethyl bacteriochlorophyllide a dehydrogenase
VVWEVDADRRTGAIGYEVIDPKADQKRYYKTIVDVSGDASLLDTLISCLAPGGEIVLAGFYDAPMTFSFPQAFMREARIRVAAQWQPNDLLAVKNLAESGRLSLDGLITHHASPHQADQAYRQAFSDKDCLKMVLDWRTLQ